MADHDQRLKTAIRQDLMALLALAAPDWAAAVEEVEEWLDQELFPDPPTGERRIIDVLARLRMRDGGRTLAHVEIESGDSLTSLRSRMPRYRPFLRGKHGLPVLSMGVYMQVGLEGIGWDEAREVFQGETLDLARWRYLGLPALDGAVYAAGENLLGVALVGLMRVPEPDQPRLKADAMLRLYESGRSDLCRYLYMSLIDAYMPLGDTLMRQYNALVRTEPRYAPMLPMVETTFERGQRIGRQEGRQDMVRKLLELRFGTLPEIALRRLQEWPIDRLEATACSLMQGDTSLATLGLVDP